MEILLFTIASKTVKDFGINLTKEMKISIIKSSDIRGKTLRKTLDVLVKIS